MDSRMTTIEEDEEMIAFAKKVAKDFNEKPKHQTYGTLDPGSFLAIRWGLDNDCVIVVKLDEYFRPVNYQQAVEVRK